MHSKHCSRVFFRFFLPILFVSLLGACASTKNTVTKPSFKSRISKVVVSDDVKKLMQKGLEQLENKKYESAEKTFKKIGQKNRLLVSPLLNLSLVYLKQNRLLESESVLRKALNRNSMWPQTYNLLGVTLRQQGRFEEAKSAYTYALQLDDNYAKAHLNIAVLYDIYLLDLENAKRHYRKYALLQPDAEKQVNSWMTDMQQRAQVSN